VKSRLVATITILGHPNATGYLLDFIITPIDSLCDWKAILEISGD
jgi:hypothetical protein